MECTKVYAFVETLTSWTYETIHKGMVRETCRSRNAELWHAQDIGISFSTQKVCFYFSKVIRVIVGLEVSKGNEFHFVDCMNVGDFTSICARVFLCNKFLSVEMTQIS